MKTSNYLKTVAVTLAVLALCPPVSAQTSIYGMISATNRDLWAAQRDYQRLLDETKALGSEPGAPSSASAGTGSNPAIPTPRYPFTATDFRSLPVRLLPDQLVNATPGVTVQEREALRRLYHQFLADFEKITRKDNVAAALTVAITLSLRAGRGRDLSQAEVNQLAANINDALAATPQFTALPPQQKQMLYESLIITGRNIDLLQTQGAQQRNIAMQLQAKELAQSVLKQWIGM